jgi:hypothetical protein
MKESKLKEVHFDVKLDENDLFKYHLKQAYSNIGVKIFSILGALSLIFDVVLFLKAIRKGSELPFYVYLFFVIAFSAANFPLFIRRTSRKLLAKNKQLTQKQYYKISEQEIVLYVENGNYALTWDNVLKAQEDKNYFTIYANKTQSYLIPKRFQANSKDIDTIREIIRQALPSDKQKLL